MNYRELIDIIYKSGQCETSKVRMMLTVTHPYSTFRFGKECNNHSNFVLPYGRELPWVMYADDQFAIRKYSDRHKQRCYSGHFHGCRFTNISVDDLYNVIRSESDIILNGINTYDELLKSQADSDIDAWLTNGYI